MLPLQVFRNKLVIFQMQKTNNALKKKMDIMKRKKADAQGNHTPNIYIHELDRRLYIYIDRLAYMWSDDECS